VRDSTRRLTIVLAVVLGVVLCLRVAAPLVVESFLDRAGDRLQEGYELALEDVDLVLSRGVFRLEGVRVDQLGKSASRPVFEVASLEVSLRVAALLRGEVLLEADVLRPRWNLVAAPPASGDALAQTGVPFAERLEEVSTFRIDRLGVRDGEVRFHDPHREPRVDVELTGIQLDLRNFGNVVDTDERRFSKGLLQARSAGGGRLRVALDANPLAPAPDFAVAARLEGMDLREVNDFFGAYGSFDVERGKLSVYTELDARDGRFQGYVRPVIEKLDVVDADEPDESALSLAWEGLVGAVAELFQNQPKERQAAQIPLRGPVERPQAGLFAAVVSLLYNAFVEALPARLEGAEVRSRND